MPSAIKGTGQRASLSNPTRTRQGAQTERTKHLATSPNDPRTGQATGLRPVRLLSPHGLESFCRRAGNEQRPSCLQRSKGRDNEPPFRTQPARAKEHRPNEPSISQPPPTTRGRGKPLGFAPFAFCRPMVSKVFVVERGMNSARHAFSDQRDGTTSFPFKPSPHEPRSTDRTNQASRNLPHDPRTGQATGLRPVRLLSPRGLEDFCRRAGNEQRPSCLQQSNGRDNEPPRRTQPRRTKEHRPNEPSISQPPSRPADGASHWASPRSPFVASHQDSVRRRRPRV